MSLTTAQIVTLSTQIAKCPGYTNQASQLLNSILQELCQNYDFDIARRSTMVSLVNGLGPYSLPADYLRSNKDDVYYTVGGDGVPRPLRQRLKAEFDMLIISPGWSSYPTDFMVDVSATPFNLYVWPPSSGAYPLIVVYYRQMPDLSVPADATVPWFPNDNYLITRLAGELMKITNDDRIEKFLGDNDDQAPLGAGTILRKYLKMKDDQEGTVKRVTLDNRFFGTSFRALKNTKIVGW